MYIYNIICTYITSHICIYIYIGINRQNIFIQKCFVEHNFANFLFLFNQETRRLIRNIENIEKKLINCQLAVVLTKHV